MCNTICQIVANANGVVITCNCGSQRFVFSVATFEGRKEVKQRGGNNFVPAQTSGNYFTSGTTLF
jgi:hypothetical protein